MNCLHCRKEITHNTWSWSASDWIHTTSQSRFCFPDSNQEATPPIFCAACHDEEVERKGMVCATCRASEPCDWIKGGHEEMRRLATLSDAIEETKQVMQYIPSRRTK